MGFLGRLRSVVVPRHKKMEEGRDNFCRKGLTHDSTHGRGETLSYRERVLASPSFPSLIQGNRTEGPPVRYDPGTSNAWQISESNVTSSLLLNFLEGF